MRRRTATLVSLVMAALALMASPAFASVVNIH